MAALAVSFLSVAGCGQEAPTEELRTVEWYKANKPEREIKLSRCHSGSIEQASTHNCINADRAKNPSAWGNTGVGSSPVGPLIVHDIIR